GDWITVQGTEANGVVEEISLTTVKIRNFDNTIITVSPQRLVEGSFQNWIGMQHSDGRRVKRMVYYDFRSVKITDDSIRENLVNKGYYKPEDIRGNEVNMSLYRKYMEKYLTSRDDVNSNMYVIVRQLEATNTGLPLEFCFFLKDKTPNEYEHNLADIMEYVYAITADFGLTIYQQYPE
ncbi:MAG TPA: mechanosensitive ion channel, partial [Xylanibacter oryzae]|nr:mechanosensitive ion channel [Xylanibacter oryzae]